MSEQSGVTEENRIELEAANLNSFLTFMMVIITTHPFDLRQTLITAQVAVPFLHQPLVGHQSKYKACHIG